MINPYYTVEFSVDVGKDLASNPEAAAKVAQQAVADGVADCLVYVPMDAGGPDKTVEIDLLGQGSTPAE